jgi:rsbT co-antagonist protein RsbR
MEEYKQQPDAPMEEVHALRQRVAELEAMVAEYHALHTQLQDVISSQEETQKALDASQQLLNIIINNLPQAIFWKDSSFVYQGCNHIFAHDIGLSDPQEIIGKTDYDLVWNRENAEIFRQVDERVLATKTPEYHTVEPKVHNGERQIWLDVSKIPLQDANGTVIGILGTYEDITERKEMEEELRASELRFRTLIESVGIATFIHHDGEFRYVNPAAERLTGYTEEELLTKRFSDLIAPESLELVQTRAAARARGEAVPQNYEIKVMMKGGHERWLEITNSLVQFEGENAIIVTALDRTERKRMEEELRASELRFRTLFDSTAVALLIAQGTTFRYTNPAGEQLLGYSCEEIRQMNFWDIIHPDHQDMVRKQGLARLRGGETIPRYEVKVVTKQGEERWVDLSASIITLDGKPAALATVVDINERKQAEQERELLQQRIIDAQRAALHELSTPIIPIARGVIAAPLIGSMDTTRARQMMEALMDGVGDHHARIVLIDLTGVSTIDTEIAALLMRTAYGVRLLGAEVVLTGIGPSMAQTLVGLGIDLSAIRTLSTLQEGIAYAIFKSYKRYQHF